MIEKVVLGFLTSVFIFSDFAFTEEYFLTSTHLGDYDILGNDEIIYFKSLNYRAKKTDYWGFPIKMVMQICKKNVYDPKSEKVILNIEYKEIYSRKHNTHLRFYNTKTFESVDWIDGIDVSLATRQIAFAALADRPTPSKPDPRGGFM
jgi:hypothetical protein